MSKISRVIGKIKLLTLICVFLSLASDMRSPMIYDAIDDRLLFDQLGCNCSLIERAFPIVSVKSLSQLLFAFSSVLVINTQ